MQPDHPAPAAQPSGSNLATLAAIGATACVAADWVHEVVGHGLVSWLTGDRIVAISSVALQNAASNRLVSAAGTSANILAGLSMLAISRHRRWGHGAYFLWIFGAFNLLNGGYLAFSAVSNGGDWAAVIRGLSPPWLWRCALGAVGLTLYIAGVRWVGSTLSHFVHRGEVSIADTPRLVWAPYIAGGVVLTAASMLNPVGPSLILVSGIGASFGLNLGLIAVPTIVAARARGDARTTIPLPFSWPWILTGVISSAVFVGVFGPGLRISDDARPDLVSSPPPKSDTSDPALPCVADWFRCG